LKTLEIPLGGDVEVGSPVYKTLLESLPYYLGDQYVALVKDDRLIIEGVPESLENQLTRAALESLVAAKAEHERVDERCLHSFEGRYPLHEGVFELLQQQRAIFATGHGKLVYSGIVADVFRAIDQFLKRHCLGLGAQQEMYPPALEAATLLRAGYFDILAQHAYFITPLKTRLDSLRAAREGDVTRASGTDHLQSPSWVLSPTVCHHCFEARKDSDMQLPLTITAINQCSRYEVHDTHGMRRLRMYWMRECVLFDEEEASIVNFLDNLISITTDALQRWGISHQVVTANDPFFSNSATSKRAFQTMFSLKRELKLPIPDGSLACASFNNHQRSLVESFNIQNVDASGKRVTSGCVAWGLDRLIFALFSQLGVEVNHWPAQMRSDLEL